MPSAARLKQIEARELELKQKLLGFKKMERDYRQDNLIEFFNRPKDEGGMPANPLQAELLEAWDNLLYKVFTYTGSNRLGKTTILSIISESVCFGKWLWNDERIWFPHNLPRKVRLVGQDWEKHIKAVLTPELRKWWPKNRKLKGGKPKKNNNGVEYFWEDEKTGSTIEIMSNLQDSDLHEGWYGDLVCIEENQLVLMGNGIWKPIKDVEIGEEVWTTCGGHVRSKHKVLKKIDNGIQDITKVTVTGGITILCTPDHEIFVRADKNNNPRDKKKRAGELTTDDKVYCPLVEIEDSDRNDFYKLFKSLLFFVRAPVKAYRRSVQYHRVRSVESVGKARVYDLSIEGNHNFICECMQVSNCYDEPPKREIRVANARGLIDRQGRELFCMTLLKEAWVDREIIKAIDKNGKPDRTVFNVNGDISINIGYGITQEGVDQFMKTLTDDEINARIHGIPAHMSGIIYSAFNRSLRPKGHLVERFKVPTNWIVNISLDIHPREKQAVLFVATNENGWRYVIDEMWDYGDGNAIADEILRRIKQNAYRVGTVIIDPLSKSTGEAQRGQDEDSTFHKIQRKLWQHDIPLQVASKDQRSGILATKDHLEGPNKEPSLFVFDDCIRFIYEIEGWMWDEKTGKPKDCVVGSTVVDTPTGKFQIKDLVGKEPYVYCYSNQLGRIDVKRAKDIRLVKKNTEVWKLAMDRGVLFATPDHLIMLRDGSYQELCNLKPYDSLMPLYRTMGVDGYAKINPNDYRSKNGQKYPGEHRLVYECVHGAIPPGMEIHHKDGNYLNHDPSNLKAVDPYKHACMHLNKGVAWKECSGCGATYLQNKRWQIYCSSKCRQRYADSRRGLPPPLPRDCEYCGVTILKPDHRQKYCGVTCRSNAYRERRKNYPSYNRVAATPNNHKVISVGFYGYEDVYDMEVEDNHNYVAEGIVIHNCDDHMMENLYRLLLLDTKYVDPDDEWDEDEGEQSKKEVNTVTGY